jgi:potassium large conductance calcium-activated channel subfamily M alpha protein 1
LWYLVITASTVGYGDFFPLTDLGKVFGIFYLSGGIAAFANFLPEIGELLGNRPKYAGTYKVRLHRD